MTAPDRGGKIQRQELRKVTTTSLAEPGEYNGKPVRVGGLVRTKKEILSKGGDRMAFITLEDHTSTAEVVIFPKTFGNCAVFLNLHFDKRGEVDIEVPQDFTVMPSSGFTSAVAERLGYPAVSYLTKAPLLQLNSPGEGYSAVFWFVFFHSRYVLETKLT